MKPIIVHSMGRVGSGTIYETLHKAGYKAGHVHSLISPRSELGAQAQKMVKRANRDVYVITPIRRPCKRNLSAYFANFGAYCHPSIRDFLNRYPHDVPMKWFTEEFIPFWHVDPFEQPFDLARGWQIYDGYILIIRATNLNQEWGNAFHALTGLDAPPLRYSNVEKRPDYKELLEKQLPAEYVEQMHQTEYYRRFYGN